MLVTTWVLREWFTKNKRTMVIFLKDGEWLLNSNTMDLSEVSALADVDATDGSTTVQNYGSPLI